MKKCIAVSITFLLTISISCQNKNQGTLVEQWKDEIIQTEKAFSAMASSDGIGEAFLHYAAEDAVLKRNEELIIGKQSIAQLFNKNPSKSMKTTLTWAPDFVDVSTSGDLGYTYGKYRYIEIDSLGNRHENEGVFHTVWKRQVDGSWKFVWD